MTAPCGRRALVELRHERIKTFRTNASSERSASVPREPIYYSTSAEQYAEVRTVLRDPGLSVRVVVGAGTKAYVAAEYSTERMARPRRERLDAA